MVKVRRTAKGHRKSSRSLVFRISRTIPKPHLNDSGISCSSPERKASGQEQSENSPSSLKIKIPKTEIFDFDENVKNKSTANDSGISCSSPERKTSGQKQTENSPSPLKIRIPKAEIFDFDENIKNKSTANDPCISDDLLPEDGNQYSQFSKIDIDMNFYSSNCNNVSISESENMKSDSSASYSCLPDLVSENEKRVSEFPNNDMTFHSSYNNELFYQPENMQQCQSRRSSRRILFRLHQKPKRPESGNEKEIFLFTQILIKTKLYYY